MNFIEAVNHKNKYPQDKVYRMSAAGTKIGLGILNRFITFSDSDNEWCDTTYLEDVNAEWYIDEN